jgi:hypothetical protein
MFAALRSSEKSQRPRVLLDATNQLAREKPPTGLQKSDDYAKIV